MARTGLLTGDSGVRIGKNEGREPCRCVTEERSKLLMSTRRSAAYHVSAHSLNQTSLSFPHVVPSAFDVLSQGSTTLGSLDPLLMLRFALGAFTHSQDCVSVCLSFIQCPASVFLLCTDILHGSRHTSDMQCT